MLAIVLAVVVAYLGFECRNDAYKAIGLLGPVCFVLIGFAVSKHHLQVPWRIVTHGLLGQLLLGILCLRLPFGRSIFQCLGDKVTIFLNYAQHGARFVYGDRICDEYVFAFAILAVVFFFSVITSIMYYLGWMQFILNGFGFLLQAMVGTTVCESVNAAGNVFLSMTESPLVIRPYIEILTVSELHAICLRLRDSGRYCLGGLCVLRCFRQLSYRSQRNGCSGFTGFRQTVLPRDRGISDQVRQH